MQWLTDTNTNTCVIRPKKLNVMTNFEQCLQLQSVTIIAANETTSVLSTSSQTEWKLTARTLCSSNRMARKCAASGQKSGALYYNCATVSARQLRVEVSAGFSICQLNIYAYPGNNNL